MDTEQRVLTALRREQPDRVPVFIYLNPYVEGWYSDDPSYADVLAACRDYADVIYDWCVPMGFFGSAAELPGQSRQLPDGATERTLHTPAGPITSVTAPDWRGKGPRKLWISSVEDARRVLSIPHVGLRPDLTDFVATRQRLAGRAVAQATFPDPICLLGDLIDPQTLAVWTIERRDLLVEMLNAAAERIGEALRFCLDAGAGPIIYFNGPEYALPPLMSPRDFEQFVVAYDAPLVDLVHSYAGRYVIIHCHGRVNRFLERFGAIGMDGLNVLEPPPIGDVVLADAKRRVGDAYCLIGNIQYDDLARGSPADVDRLVGDAIRAGAPGGGFILSPCASPYERPLPRTAAENLRRYLVKARQYGAYPLKVPSPDGRQASGAQQSPRPDGRGPERLP